jgi:uncharacterized protein (UPF0262 family)
VSKPARERASDPPAEPPAEAPTQPNGRLVAVELDHVPANPAGSFLDKERAVAIRDLIADNHFSVAGSPERTFRLQLSLATGKLVLAIGDRQGATIARHILSLSPFRRVMHDYFLVCDAYYRVVGGPAPTQIEAIDVGRRALHNEGASLLQERLAGRILVDFPTARRLFTLVCTLHWKG